MSIIHELKPQNLKVDIEYLIVTVVRVLYPLDICSVSNKKRKISNTRRKIVLTAVITATPYKNDLYLPKKTTEKENKFPKGKNKLKLE